LNGIEFSMMPPKSAHQRLSSYTIQKVLDDPALAELLDKKVKDVGVNTSFGYSAVLREFLASDAVLSKLKEWEENGKDDDTATTAATSWVGGLSSSFTTKLLFDDVAEDPHTISPLTTKSMAFSPHASMRSAFSDYGPSRTPKSELSSVSPSRTFPSLPFTSSNDGFNHSPTFRKQLIEFMAPRNPFNLNLKDEAVMPKKQIPKRHRNLQSRRRTSQRQADLAATLQSVDFDHGINDAESSEESVCDTP
jgi:hypothetical protein